MKRSEFVALMVGAGPVPADMLRYDNARVHPDDEELAINVPDDQPPRAVRIIHNRPLTERRWASFGWRRVSWSYHHTY